MAASRLVFLLACTFAIMPTPTTAAHRQDRIGSPRRPSMKAPAEQKGTGTIIGFVTAPDDARLPGATITVRNLATGGAVVVVTASHGGYTASGLPAGDYEVRAALPLFDAATVERVSLAAGESREVDFKLHLSGLAEIVTVVAALGKDSVEASEIRDSSARDIGEALGAMNGVDRVRKGAIANDVMVNGFQSRDLSVLIDGDRIYGACPNGMDPAVFHADFAEVDHLEVGKGPFDVRHAASLGGVINVVTRPPAVGLHATANLAVGSYGLVNPSVTGSYGTRSISLLGGVSYRAASPYRDGSGTLFTQYANYRPDTVASRAYDATTGWARFYVSPRPHHALQVAYTEQRTSQVLYPYLLMDGLSDDADRANVSYEADRAQASISRMSARAYYTKVRHWMTDALRVSSAGMPRDYSMATQADTETYGGNVEVGFGRATAGFEIFRRKWDATTTMAGSKYVPQYSIPFVAADVAGAFLEYEHRLAAATRVELGGRFDWSRSVADAARATTDLYLAYNGTRATAASDTGMSGKMRIVHHTNGNLELVAGLGHTVRPPDPQERYFALKRMGNDWVGNPLLPVTGNTGVNGGVNYRAGRAAMSLDVSYDWLSNFITVNNQARLNKVAGVMNASARSYSAVDARMASAEATLTCPITDRLVASANASYVRATKDTDPARNITSPNVAEIHPLRGRIELRYNRAAGFAEAQWVLSAAQVHVDTDLQEEPMPGYGLLNVRAGVGKKGFRLTVGVDNVFDLLWVDQLSYQRDPFRLGVRVREPGRSLYSNLSYRF